MKFNIFIGQIFLDFHNPIISVVLDQVAKFGDQIVLCISENDDNMRLHVIAFEGSNLEFV
jgi:hypothetical protein